MILNLEQMRNRQSWYPEPFYCFVKNDDSSGLSSEIGGTFRSSQCKRVSCKFINADWICSSSANIPNLPSFWKHLPLWIKKTADTGEQNLRSVRNEYLTSEEIVEKVTEQRAKLDSLESKLFFETSRNLQLKMRLRNLKEKLEEYAKRGSMKAICPRTGAIQWQNSSPGFFWLLSLRTARQKAGET